MKDQVLQITTDQYELAEHELPNSQPQPLFSIAPEHPLSASILGDGLVSTTHILRPGNTGNKNEAYANSPYADSFLDQVFEHSPNLTYVIDREYRVIKANKAFLALFPESQREGVTGNKLPNHQSPFVDTALIDIIKGNHIAFSKGEFAVSGKFHTLDGEIRTVQTQKTRFTDPSGEQFVLSVSNDVTDKDNQIAKLQRSNDDLEQFVFLASHDLRAPLQAIQKLITWIEDDHGSSLTSCVQEYFSLIKGRTNRMVQLLQDLLEYARVDKALDVAEPIDLQELLVAVHSFIDGNTHFSISTPNVQVNLPRIAFQIVAMNLLSNTIKHHHKPSGNIQVSVEQTSGGYRFLFSDDGPGIPPEHQQRIFNMFQTLKPKDDVEGSGMGLALIRKVLSHYNGSIRLVTENKHGACFEVFWPVQNNSISTHADSTDWASAGDKKHLG